LISLTKSLLRAERG